MEQVPVIAADGPVLIFGGPYSNLQATDAVLVTAHRLGIPPERTVCTGDLAAYCGDPVATIARVRASGIHVVMGNCDEQLAAGGGSCGCGFPAGGTCERLSAAWFAYADAEVGAEARVWLAALPRRIDLHIGGVRLAVIHGSPSLINRFVFATTPRSVKRSELDGIDCDGIVGGHCGLPFTEVVDGRLWHNAGVVGMPANDGTPRTWYSILRPGTGGLTIEHHALDYDHAAAARAMQRAGLPPDYRVALISGIWPSCDVLPARELQEQGNPLEPGSVLWTSARPTRKDVKIAARPSALLWPTTMKEAATVSDQERSTAAACCTPAQPETQVSANGCCDSPRNADATHDLYRAAALDPDKSLCCSPSNPVWRLPELRVPQRMLDMNYGCGSTVHPGDLAGSPTILYVGVGGGLELLQFAYFSRRRGAVIGLDVVDEMLEACSRNLEEAEETNPWFKRSFVDLRTGDAMRLPIADGAVDVAAQNCLFNIFHEDDLRRALAEMSRVLKPGGRLILSDPVCETEIPEALRADERLRSMCLTGAIPLSAYVERLASAGFGTVEVRARRPYRVLGPAQFGTDRPILLESVEICAIKSEVAADGATVFAGQSAIYFGPEPGFSDGNGIHLPSNQPIPVSVATAERLKALKRGDVFVSEPTWFQSSGGGGCC